MPVVLNEPQDMSWEQEVSPQVNSADSEICLDRPSKSWDAASIRILTIAVFQHRSTGKAVVAMNTHLDDQGSKSRLEAAKIILEQVRISKKLILPD